MRKALVKIGVERNARHIAIVEKRHKALVAAIVDFLHGTRDAKDLYKPVHERLTHCLQAFALLYLVLAQGVMWKQRYISQAVA